MRCRSAGAVRGAHRRRDWGSGARGIVQRSCWSRWWTVEGVLHELEELFLRGKDLGVNLFKESEMSHELLRKSRDSISEVGNAREDVYRLLGSIGAGQRVPCAEAIGACIRSGRICSSLANRLRSPIGRRRLARDNLRGLHIGCRLRQGGGERKTRRDVVVGVVVACGF